MSRSLKKGPFVEPRLLGRIEAMNEAGKKRGCENLVACIYYLP